MNRREILKSGIYASTTAFFPFISRDRGPLESKTIVITGAHPDDPESGCGGTIARLNKEGHKIKILYFTRGEAGIQGKSHEEAASIREKEARNACEILGAEPYFFGQIDGSTFINSDEYSKMENMISGMAPDIVFTQWPIDTHRDHRHLSLLVYGTWLSMNRRFSLYYYEVMTGIQTQTFSPGDFADITEYEALKRKSCYAHASQDPDDFYGVHIKMNIFRGMQGGFKYAEAFVRQASDIKQFI